MSVLQEVQKLAIKKKVPAIRAGNTVRVHQKIKEGEKERIQIFEGLVIKLNSGHGADKTFTVRKIVQGIGVEKVFSLYSPTIVKIEIKKKAKVRRSKLYYMRERSGKSARLKEGFVTEAEMEDSAAALAEAHEEAEKAKKEKDGIAPSAEEASAEGEQSEAKAPGSETPESKDKPATAPENTTPEPPETAEAKAEAPAEEPKKEE